MIGADRDVDDECLSSAARDGHPGALEVSDFIRDVAARVAFELATTPEGRAAGLSVEVWPERGVWLRGREGHELCVLIEHGDAGVRGRWEQARPSPDRARPHVSHGSLGEVHLMGEDELRTLMASWLAQTIAPR